MGGTGYDAYKYSDLIVTVFGILGNILVIISILRQKNMLKNHYYFLVLQLSICDLGPLIIYLLDHINLYFLERPYLNISKFYCLGYHVIYLFQTAGVGMMLAISVLRYRATVHPLNPTISRCKLKFVCGLVYIVGFIASYGPALPKCFILRNDLKIVYTKYLSGYLIICFLLCPTIFMAVVYFKIGRALINQNKYIKSLCANPALRGMAPNSSFNVAIFFRTRKTFIICLLTVLCFAAGNVLLTVRFILVIGGEFRLLMKHSWIAWGSDVLKVAGTNSVNPLIYGILDKKLLKFWKLCHKKKRKSPKH